MKPPLDLNIDMMEITDHEFRLFSELIYKHFGIHLTEAKRSLLVRRLQSLMRKEGYPNFKAYYQHLVEAPNDQLFSELVNRITTNYTFFNREPDHFKLFTDRVLPEFEEMLRNQPDLRVWCAAASTGEEPYMLAMLIREYFGANYKRWNGGVLATDISRRALEQAQQGIYTAEQIEPLPNRLRLLYFRKIDQDRFQVIPELRNEITYRRFNLINRLYPFKKPFHIIFCRNVMIYFDQPTKDQVTSSLRDSLAPGGYLFIGHSESISRNRSGFEYICPAVYRKVGY